jgi:hypothetical protein
MNDARRRGRPGAGDPRGTEAAVLGLAAGENVLTGTPDALVAGIGPELVEEDHLPDGAAVLRGIARACLLPMAVGLLCGQDRGDRIGGHRRTTARHHISVVGGAIEQLPEGQVSNRRIACVEQPVERVCPENRLPARHRRSLEPAYGAGRR